MLAVDGRKGHGVCDIFNKRGSGIGQAHGFRDAHRRRRKTSQGRVTLSLFNMVCLLLNYSCLMQMGWARGQNPVGTKEQFDINTGETVMPIYEDPSNAVRSLPVDQSKLLHGVPSAQPLHSAPWLPPKEQDIPIHNGTSQQPPMPPQLHRSEEIAGNSWRGAGRGERGAPQVGGGRGAEAGDWVMRGQAPTHTNAAENNMGGSGPWAGPRGSGADWPGAMMGRGRPLDSSNNNNMITGVRGKNEFAGGGVANGQPPFLDQRPLAAAAAAANPSLLAQQPSFGRPPWEQQQQPLPPGHAGLQQMGMTPPPPSGRAVMLPSQVPFGSDLAHRLVGGRTDMMQQHFAATAGGGASAERPPSAASSAKRKRDSRDYSSDDRDAADDSSGAHKGAFKQQQHMSGHHHHLHHHQRDERERERNRERERERGRDTNRDRDRMDTREHSRDRDRERARDGDRGRGRDPNRDRDRDRERARDGEGERARDRDSRDRDRDRDRDRMDTREHNSSSRSTARHKEETDNTRDRDRDRDRQRERSRSSEGGNEGSRKEDRKDTTHQHQGQGQQPPAAAAAQQQHAYKREDQNGEMVDEFGRSLRS